MHLRVLHVIASDRRRGAEVFATELMRAFRDNGVMQQVAILRTGRSPVALPAPVTPLQANHPLPGVQVDPGAVVRLARALRSRRPDIVQVHGGQALKYTVMAAAGSKMPIVYRRIGGAPHWITRGLQRNVYAALMRRPARIIVVAESVRRETLSLFGVPGKRVVTIPNGVDARRMRPSRTRRDVRRGLGIPQTSLVILSVGALSWEKDPLMHVEVTARVLNDSPNTVHLIVGDGPMRAELEHVITRKALSGRVLLLGVRTDVADLMHASDVVLFASRPDGMEGMPGMVIEAGMVGVPVAGYDVAGVSEVVQDARTGYLVPHGDIGGLASRVSSLLADGELRQSMGKAAREYCWPRFDVRTLAPQYLDVYRDVLERR